MLIAPPTHPGVSTLLVRPSLPAATKTGIPAARAPSTAVAEPGSSVSQKPWGSESSNVPPRLMLITVIPSSAWWTMHQFSASKMSEKSAVSLQLELDVFVEEKTLRATIFASGATPAALADVAAIEVPWPSQSAGSLSLSARSVPPVTFWFGKGAPPSAWTR